MFRRSLIIFVLSFFTFLPIHALEDGFVVETIGTWPLIEPRKLLIQTVLRSNIMQFSYTALRIVLDTNQKEPRGKMQWHQITLSPSVPKDAEFIKLLVHEVSHYIDIFYLTSSLNGKEDPSQIFYRISWQDKSIKKPSETLAAFVSGYAATNQYEDFAESLTFYIFHNDEFMERALKNDSLRQKYLFLSNFVFPDGEFLDTNFGIGKVPGYLWDTTKLPISLKKYLYSLAK